MCLFQVTKKLVSLDMEIGRNSLQSGDGETLHSVSTSNQGKGSNTISVHLLHAQGKPVIVLCCLNLGDWEYISHCCVLSRFSSVSGCLIKCIYQGIWPLQDSGPRVTEL